MGRVDRVIQQASEQLDADLGRGQDTPRIRKELIISQVKISDSCRQQMHRNDFDIKLPLIPSPGKCRRVVGQGRTPAWLLNE